MIYRTQKKMLGEDLGHMITYHVILTQFIRRRYPKGLVFGSNIKEALVLIFLSAIFKLLRMLGKALVYGPEIMEALNYLP